MYNNAYITAVKQTAKEVHDFIYSNIKLSDQEHATFIAGALIALQDNKFRRDYKNDYFNKADRFIGEMMEAIKYSIEDCKGYDKPDKRAITLAEFNFIERNEQLKKVVTIGGTDYIAVQYLLMVLEDGVFEVARAHPEFDILGAFYDQFTKYSASDQQSLGIVLTPLHVAEFMTDLLNIQDTDVVLDTCCGSASLLLTAGGTSHQSIGVELNSRMAAIALANMIIKKLPTYIWLGNSFDEDICNEIREYHPNKLIINPPYSQQDKELSFVLNGLNLLEPNGLGVVILPVGAASRREVFDLKNQILQKHSLLGIFTMPEKLFYPVGTHTEILLFKAHVPHGNNTNTFIANIKDDGLEVVKNQSRVDTHNKWAGIKEDFLNKYYNCTNSENTVYTQVKAVDDWTADAFIREPWSLSDHNFIEVIRNYILFQQGGINKGDLQEYINFIFNAIENVPDLKDAKDSKDTYTLDDREFSDFSFEEIFKMSRGRGGTATGAKNNPGENLYIGASNENNGITQYTSLAPTEKENTITVANNGSVGATFYQRNAYLASSDVTVLELKDEELTPAIALFLCTVCREAGKEFNYGRKWGISRMRETLLKLPINEEGLPDWEFMENYINSLPYSKYI